MQVHWLTCSMARSADVIFRLGSATGSPVAEPFHDVYPLHWRGVFQHWFLYFHRWIVNWINVEFFAIFWDFFNVILWGFLLASGSATWLGMRLQNRWMLLHPNCQSVDALKSLSRGKGKELGSATWAPRLARQSAFACRWFQLLNPIERAMEADKPT